jgi:hypothetical protein
VFSETAPGGFLTHHLSAAPPAGSEIFNEQIDETFRQLNYDKIDISLINEIAARRKEFCGWPSIVIIKDGNVYTNNCLKSSFEYLLEFYQIPDCIFYYFDGDGPIYPMNLEDGFAPPIFSGTKQSTMNNVILIFNRYNFFRGITPEHYLLDKLTPQLVMDDCEWECKTNKLHWRGQLTDITFGRPRNNSRYMHSPRLRVTELSKYAPGLIDAAILFTDPSSTSEIWDLLVWDVLVQYDLPRTQFFCPMREQLRYKYLLCMDGMTCTYPGYFWRLKSNSCVFKVDSPNYEWFYKKLEPWVHYVPVKHDLTDLIENILWAQKNDDEAKKIAQNGKKFAETYLTKEMYLFYTYKVLLKWASLQSFDKEDFERAFELLEKEKYE